MIAHAWLVVTMGAVAALFVLSIAVEWPQLFSKGLAGLKGKERADVLSAGRDFGLKLAAGIGAVAAAVLGWGRFELSREERDVARLSLDADRFSRAVDQLGSDKGNDVVLGGLYALEALGNSARDYQSQITEVLSAFIREHVRDREVSAESVAPERPTLRTLTVTEEAALTILSRRNKKWHGTIDLSRANLANARLTGARLSGANLTDARWDKASSPLWPEGFTPPVLPRQ